MHGATGAWELNYNAYKTEFKNIILLSESFIFNFVGVKHSKFLEKGPILANVINVIQYQNFNRNHRKSSILFVIRFSCFSKKVRQSEIDIYFGL